MYTLWDIGNLASHPNDLKPKDKATIVEALYDLATYLLHLMKAGKIDEGDERKQEREHKSSSYR